MSVKGIKQVRINIGKITADIDGPKTREAITRVLEQGGALAATMTPIDTGNLVNSQKIPTVTGRKGEIAYTAKYAAAVHAAPGVLKGQPRADFGKTRAGVAFGGGTGVGTYWSPDAEPQFLEKGFQQLKPSIPAILKAVYEV